MTTKKRATPMEGAARVIREGTELLIRRACVALKGNVRIQVFCGKGPGHLDRVLCHF